ncbi:hypothetical protein HEK131_60230 [Streptomyces seoulensis]|nr:hypothetical protein HEK131_60230 [Streptomyces seoulensis]
MPFTSISTPAKIAPPSASPLCWGRADCVCWVMAVTSDVSSPVNPRWGRRYDDPAPWSRLPQGLGRTGESRARPTVSHAIQKKTAVMRFSSSVRPV